MNASSAQIERNQRACDSASRDTCSGRGAVAMSQLARQGAPNRAANRVGSGNRVLARRAQPDAGPLCRAQQDPGVRALAVADECGGG
jgi:hypothetical protein